MRQEGFPQVHNAALARVLARAELRHRLQIALRRRSFQSVASFRDYLQSFAIHGKRGIGVPTIAEGYALALEFINEQNRSTGDVPGIEARDEAR